MIVINNFDVVQDEIVQKKDELKYAREALEERKPKFTVSVVHEAEPEIMKKVQR